MKTRSQEAQTHNVALECEVVLFKSLCPFLGKMRNVVHMTGRWRYSRCVTKQVHKDMQKEGEQSKIIPDFKLSLCSECCILSFRRFPGV